MAYELPDLREYFGRTVIVNIKYDFDKYIGVLKQVNDRITKLEPHMDYKHFFRFYIMRGGGEVGALSILEEKGASKSISIDCIVAIEVARFF